MNGKEIYEMLVKLTGNEKKYVVRNIVDDNGNFYYLRLNNVKDYVSSRELGQIVEKLQFEDLEFLGIDLTGYRIELTFKDVGDDEQ